MNAILKRYDNVYYLVGRCLLGLYFIAPGIMKITGYAGTLALMQSKGVPLAEVLLPVTIVLQIGLGLLLIVGKHLRLSSLLLFGIVILINIYIHNFWSADAADQLQNFIKNLGIAAGLLVLATKQVD